MYDCVKKCTNVLFVKVLACGALQDRDWFLEACVQDWCASQSNPPNYLTQGDSQVSQYQIW